MERPLVVPPPPSGVRLLHPDDYHVTVAFFGGLDSDPTAAVEPLLRHMQTQPLHALAEGALLLPRLTYASVVALSFGEGNSHLVDYIAAWRNELLSAVGLPPETRPVLPHLTIARMKPSRNDYHIRERTRWAQDVEHYLPIDVLMTSVALYTWCSERVAGLPQYRRVLEVELS